MFDVIGFDADDTLWDNEFRYRQAKLKFIDLMNKIQPADEIGARLDDIEIANLSYYGYGVKSFGLSMVEAALELSGNHLEASVGLTILDLVKEMLGADVPLLASTQETLARLADAYPLMLITKGDLFEQERKIERSGVARYFKFIEVVSEKTEAGYRRVLGKYGIDPTRFLMVGNSLKSDILPVLKLGGQAVYIPHHQTWHHETVDEIELGNPTYKKIKGLEDLPRYLKRLTIG